MNKIIAWLLALGLLLAMVQNAQKEGFDIEKNIDNSGVFSWSLHLFEEDFYSTAIEVLREVGVTRVYQNIPSDYLKNKSTDTTLSAFASDGIEFIALIGERDWGLAESDREIVFRYIDAVVEYNSEIGKENPIRTIALDVETYTFEEWGQDPYNYFEAYVYAMSDIYAYAHEAGLRVVQIIPTFYNTIDEELFRKLITDCCDEISMMNYAKIIQVTSVKEEIELCRELGKRVETIFETQPYTDEYQVSEVNSYFYDGLQALNYVRDKIFATYRYEGLYAAYHNFESIYYMVTGENMD